MFSTDTRVRSRFFPLFRTDLKHTCMTLYVSLVLVASQSHLAKLRTSLGLSRMKRARAVISLAHTSRAPRTSVASTVYTPCRHTTTCCRDIACHLTASSLQASSSKKGYTTFIWCYNNIKCNDCVRLYQKGGVCMGEWFQLGCVIISLCTYPGGRQGGGSCQHNNPIAL